MSIFQRRKPPRYPHRAALPIVRRRLPMRYHMKHQFGVRDLAFLQTMHALTGAPLSNGNTVELLKNGDRVRITGLGILEVKDRPARMGRNPATGAAIQIAASKKVAFRVAKELKETV